MMGTEGLFAWLNSQLGREVDASGLVVFRVMFGIIACIAAMRFVAYGWVQSLLVDPTFHFVWVPGVPVAPAPVLYGIFLVQALAGLAIAFGWRVRLSLCTWLGSFVYVELLDKTLYLNHYVLFTLVGLTLLVSPGVCWTTRAGRRVAPSWVLWLLRIEFGMVYFWAAVAKLNADWLLRAEPLSTWLGARVDMPVVGAFLAMPETAIAMSWGGLLYDLSIPFLLLFPRTRSLGILLLIVFHVSVGVLFPIGIFPILMIAGSTLFLDPSWPRRFMRRRWEPVVFDHKKLSGRGGLVWLLAVLVLVSFPGRHILWDGNVNWTERGYRFSWRVLLNEKSGLLDYRVKDVDTGRVWRVLPAQELTELQHKQARTQPDMIRDLGLHLKERFRRQLGGDYEVYVDSWVSLNGRRAQRMIRGDIDVTKPLSELWGEGWVLPLVE